MSKGPPPEGYDDNPEWMDADFAAARPATEMHPPHIVAVLTKRGPGRPAGSDKARIAIRIDQAVLDHFKAAGPGWQTRMNDALRKVAGL